MNIDVANMINKEVQSIYNVFGNVNKSGYLKGIKKDCGIASWNLKDTKERKKAAADKISYYALKDNNEFISESIAEYMAGNPRDTAKKVVEILFGGR